MRKEILCGIYMITSPSGKIYIGQALDIYMRWDHYMGLHCNRQPKLYASFKKYGVENHKFEIAETCMEDQLNEREIYFIKFYDTFNTLHGLNLQSGGHNGRHAEETKIKIRNSHIGKIISNESKEKNRIAHLGKKQSLETIEKRVSKFRGKKQTQEVINNRINRLTGLKRSEDKRLTIFQAHNTPEYLLKLSQISKRTWERIRQEKLTMIF